MNVCFYGADLDYPDHTKELENSNAAFLNWAGIKQKVISISAKL